MKIIISHDVDRLTTREHWHDLSIPKDVARLAGEWARGMISLTEARRRLFNLLTNKLQNIAELMAFDRSQAIPATFFVAVDGGRDLWYSQAQAAQWIRRIRAQGFAVGVHGIHYDSAQGVRTEFERFHTLTGLAAFGVRLHNLPAEVSRQVVQAHGELFARVGYRFSSSSHNVCNPYRVGGTLWEFPMQIMEGNLFYQHSPLMNRTLEHAQAETLALLAQARAAGLRYFTMLFHDCYFTPAFAPLQQWYTWLIAYLKAEGYTFIDFAGACTELEQEA